MNANVRTLALAVLGVVLTVVAYGHHPWTLLRIAGAILGLVALPFFLIARVQLGASFAVRAQVHELVTTGLYARIRNPVYLFGAITLIGLLLYVDKPWYLLGLIVLVPLQVYRVRKEEAVLSEKFGDTYLRYKERTWF